MLALSHWRTRGSRQFVCLPARLWDPMVGVVIPCPECLTPVLVLEWTLSETAHFKASNMLVEALVFLKGDLVLPGLRKGAGPRHLELPSKDLLDLVLHKAGRGLLELLKVVGLPQLQPINRPLLDPSLGSNPAISLGQRLRKHKQEVSQGLLEFVGCPRHQAHGRDVGLQLLLNIIVRL